MYNHGPLTGAIQEREREYRAALDRIKGTLDDSPPVCDSEEHPARQAVMLLREALEIVRCARRMLPACSLEQIHRAFGAPGDFGYETPIGEALDTIYRASWSEPLPDEAK